MKNEEYSVKLVASTEKIVSGESATRGKIYDRNYNLLVDNEVVAPIYYKKQDGVKLSPYLLKEVYEAPDNNNDKFGNKIYASEVNNYYSVFYLNIEKEFR